MDKFITYFKSNFRCCCWSPKGKQIVVGFANGKLVQYKPDLKPAKAIDCPPNIVAGSFDTISVQWLSTYQFAAVFLGYHENARPGELYKYISINFNNSINKSF